MSREPAIFGVAPHRGERDDERNGMVRVGLIYRGLKNEPTDALFYSPDDAKKLAAMLLVAAYQCEGVRL